jgi:hypothetical protein
MNLCGKKIFNNELNQYGLTRPVKKPFPRSRTNPRRSEEGGQPNIYVRTYDL